MIEVKEITKHFGSTVAVDQVSFTVDRGEIVGFLGPNGAGKSTTMKMLTCYLAPTSGTAAIDGHDILEQPLKARARVGYLPENTPLYEDLGVLEFLSFMARMHGVAPGDVKRRVRELIDVCDIGKMAHKDIGELSKGYRQRVGLAQALLHDPPVLILDEPTSGLDPGQIVEIRELIKRIAREKCILLSTHILPEAQNTCNRILIISDGRIAGEGTADELLNLAGGEERYTVTLKGRSAGELANGLSQLPGVHSLETLSENGATRFSLSAERGSVLNEQIFDFAVASNLKLLELHHVSTSLEDVFLKLTGIEHVQPAASDAASPAVEAPTAGGTGDE